MRGVPVGENVRDTSPDVRPDVETADVEATDGSAAAGQAVGGAAPRTTGSAPRGLGVLGWLRWAWRQLTSMRTALILLFLLAVASVPGSVLPQQGIDPSAVNQYFAAHPSLAPFLNRLSLFSVFAAPWFAAIYLLLFLSLAGCVLPRTFRLVGSARQQPPRAPRHLTRLPVANSYATALTPADALAGAGRQLARQRFRLRTGDGWISAEKGYLREVGNLLFHLALLALLASVGIGGVFGYKANRLLVAGQSFANTPTALDVFRPGRLVSASDLAPFSIGLKSFRATYVTSGPQQAEPETFNAALRYSTAPGAPSRNYDLRVNHPLNIDGASVYLIGHGYAPEFRVTDGAGHVVFNGPVPFIPVEQSGFTSEGVVKVPDASPAQLGFAGVFLPSAADESGRLVSVFPAALQPRVSLVSYAGNLGLNDGQSQSVYQLDLSGMHRLSVAPRPLAVGQSITLPGKAGKLTFTGYRQWASLAITYDPGQLPALISASVALAGLILSFLIRRRRVFVRAVPGPDGRTVVDVGGLARSDAAGGFEVEFAELARDLRKAQRGSPLPAGARNGSPASASAAASDVTDRAPEAPGGADHDDEEQGRGGGAAALSGSASGGDTAGGGNDQSLGSPEGE
jgi:cytochrome c biogenesis protein